MASLISPQSMAVGEQSFQAAGTKMNYAATVSKEHVRQFTHTVLCPVRFERGEPMVEFTTDEVKEFVVEEGLHQAVVVKFSYGKPELHDLRLNFPKQFDVKGSCNIGQLEYRHILVRFDLYEDYVSFVSRSTGHINSKGDEFFFRTFPWTIGFDPKVETSKAVVWISLPELPPNYFAKKSLMSIASAVGKPLAVDKATKERTRPSAARVKVLLDLLDKHPTTVKISVVDKVTGQSTVFLQKIVYDHLPMYCTYCKHQGHDENSCRLMKGRNKNATDNIEQTARTGLEENSVAQLQGDARQLLNAIRDANQVQEKENVTQRQEGIIDNLNTHNKMKDKANATGILTIFTGQQSNGNIGGQWKEVKDNRVKVVNNETSVQNNTGHEVSLQNVTQQNQKINTLALVEFEKDQTNQLQNFNRFAVLEMEQSGCNEGNKLTKISETVEAEKSGTLEPNGYVSAAANVINPAQNTTVQIDGISKVVKQLNPNANAFNLTTKDNLQQSQSQQESTAQWAHKRFGNNLVTTNQSCQDIPSQDTQGISEQVNEKERLALTGGNLWEDQAEEDSEEGELPDGIHGDDEANDEENEEEENSVNDNVTNNVVNAEKITNKLVERSHDMVSQETLTQGQKRLTKESLVSTENAVIQGINEAEKHEKDITTEGKNAATTAVHANTLALNRANTLSPDRANNMFPSRFEKLEEINCIAKGQQGMSKNTDLPNDAGSNSRVRLLKDTTAKDIITLCPSHELATPLLVQEKEDENMLGNGKDLDEESTTQNFLNVARKGDISPTHIAKVKSAAKGKKGKMDRNNSSMPKAGIQTRRAVTKSNNL